MVSYKEIMKSGLVRKPLRSLMSTYSTFRHSPRASLPFKLKFESSAVCNLKCRMCPLNKGLRRKQGFLKFENFKYVFDQINPAYLNLTGIGEPFLNPDIFKIISYAKKKKAIVKFDTNATLLNMENIRRILRTKIDVLSVSIDGTNKKNYERIRIGSNFDLVKYNVKNLVAERNRINSSTKIHMFFVVQEKNINNLPDFIRLANELGVDYVAGSFVVSLGKNKNEKNKNLKGKDLENIIKETKKVIKTSKAEVSVGPLLEFLESPKNSNFVNKPCFMPWYSIFITWDGWANPCDFSCDNEIIFGNAFKEPFKKIWNNNKLRNFRMKLLKERKSIPLCTGCGVDETYIQKEIDKINTLGFTKLLQYKR